MRQKSCVFLRVLTLALTAIAAACSSPQPTTSEKAASPPPKPVSAEERAKWYQDCWILFNDRKWDDFKKCYADNATSRQFGYGKEDSSGPDAIVAGGQDFAKTFPDGRGESQLILVNANRIGSLYLLRGTNTGPLTGPDVKVMPATNKKFGVLFGHHVETDPAALKVVQEFGAMDSSTLAGQLGLSKNPVRPAMDKGEPMPKIVIARNDDTEMKNIDSEKAQLDAWNKHDAAAVDMFIADDAVIHDMTEPKDQTRKEGSDGNKQFWKAFPDAKLSVPTMWAAGDYVVSVGTFDGTNDGDFPAMKLKKTGKKVSIPYFSIDRLEGGKVKEGWLVFDAASFAKQLGLQ